MFRPLPPRPAHCVFPGLRGGRLLFAALLGLFSPGPEGWAQVGASKDDGFSREAGRMSLAVSLPQGGSPWGPGAVGLRYFLGPAFAVTPLLQGGYDKAARTWSAGLITRAQIFAATSGRAHGFGFAQLSLGKNGGDGQAEKDFQTGLGFGFGIEISLTRELSTSVDVGMSSVLLPTARQTLATTTSQISLHYHLGT